jgi:hypothetical protein
MMAIKSYDGTFGAWLKAEIQVKGRVSVFTKRYNLHPVWGWISNWRIPNWKQRSALAAALSDWSGHPYTIDQINDAIDPTGSWRIPPSDFGGWLRWTIEQHGACNEFALMSGLTVSSVQAWVTGASFPLGKTGQIVKLSKALTKWTGQKITIADIQKRILLDPLSQKKAKFVSNRLHSASVKTLPKHLNRSTEKRSRTKVTQ